MVTGLGVATQQFVVARAPRVIGDRHKAFISPAGTRQTTTDRESLPLNETWRSAEGRMFRPNVENACTLHVRPASASAMTALSTESAPALPDGSLSLIDADPAFARAVPAVDHALARRALTLRERRISAGDGVEAEERAR